MPSSKQQKGYRSNAKVREWLLEHGFSYVWFHPHPAHADLINIDQEKSFYSKDIFGLFDGACFDSRGDLVLFQVKTNSWEGCNQIVEWGKGKHVKVIFFNVVDRQGIKIRTLNYPPTVFV